MICDGLNIFIAIIIIDMYIGFFFIWLSDCTYFHIFILYHCFCFMAIIILNSTVMSFSYYTSLTNVTYSLTHLLSH